MQQRVLYCDTIALLLTRLVCVCLVQQIEDFAVKCVDMMMRLSKIRDSLNNAEIPDSVDIARAMLEEHNTMKTRVSKAPIEALEGEGQAILEKIRGSQHKSQGQCVMSG